MFIDKRQKSIATIWLIIIGFILISASAYWFWVDDIKQYFDVKKGMVCAEEAKLCPDGSSVGRIGPNCEFAECPKPGLGQSDDAVDVSGWQTYRNEKYGFEMKYLPSWELLEILDRSSGGWMSISFGRHDMVGTPGYDGEFFVFVFSSNDAQAEEFIKSLGDQFEDRKEKRENIVINNQSAVKVTITTPSISAWIYESVILKKNNTVYIIGNGAVYDLFFKDFYNTFKFE